VTVLSDLLFLQAASIAANSIYGTVECGYMMTNQTAHNKSSRLSETVIGGDAHMLLLLRFWKMVVALCDKFTFEEKFHI